VAGAIANATARHAEARRGGQGPCHCKEERVQGSFCVGVVSRNNNMDYGLFCSLSRGFSVGASARLRAPRVGRLRARAKPELGRFGLFLFLAELVKLFYFNSELDLYI